MVGLLRCWQEKEKLTSDPATPNEETLPKVPLESLEVQAAGASKTLSLEGQSHGLCPIATSCPREAASKNSEFNPGHENKNQQKQVVPFVAVKKELVKVKRELCAADKTEPGQPHTKSRLSYFSCCLWFSLLSDKFYALLYRCFFCRRIVS